MIKVTRKYIEPMQFNKKQLFDTKEKILQRIYDRLSPLKSLTGEIHPQNK